jgi:undecaprenyl diphosphate synthase
MKWSRLNRTKNDLKQKIDWSGHLPKHIAIMMDGNGRWAKRRGLPRSAGHYAGMQTMRQTIGMCHKNGIDSLTLYAFSTENWKRPKNEVDYILSLVSAIVQDTNVRELNENNVKVFFIGDISKFPEETASHAKSRRANGRKQWTKSIFCNELWRQERYHSSCKSDSENQKYGRN